MDLPEFNIFQCDNSEEIVTVEKSSTTGEVTDVMILHKKNGNTALLGAVSPGVLGTIHRNDYDADTLSRRFRYGEMRTTEIDESVPSRTESGQERETNDAEPCASYRDVHLAAVYDSSFCASYGNDSSDADDRVASLVAAASARHGQNGLCARIKLSHLEGWCDPETDPYETVVETNRSGCGESGGALREFREHWNKHRDHVRRDAAHFFSGTRFECEGGSCVLGCAFSKATCVKARAYGVSFDAFPNLTTQSLLLAHEIGHNNGAAHDADKGSIMYGSFSPQSTGFSEGSIASMNEHYSTFCEKIFTPFNNFFRFQLQVRLFNVLVLLSFLVNS